jgi:hypothetical protein
MDMPMLIEVSFVLGSNAALIIGTEIIDDGKVIATFSAAHDAWALHSIPCWDGMDLWFKELEIEDP